MSEQNGDGKKELEAARTTLEVCKSSMALIEMTQFQGRQALQVANSLNWLMNVKMNLEAQIKQLENIPRVIIPK